MKIFHNIEISFYIRPLFLKTLSYLFILIFIGAYFIAHWFNLEKLIDILSINTGSAVFWIIIILIAVGHLDFFREIIKDVARSKISEFAISNYFRESVTQLLSDEEFQRGVNDIVDKSSKPIKNELLAGQEELDTSNKL